MLLPTFVVLAGAFSAVFAQSLVPGILFGKVPRQKSPSIVPFLTQTCTKIGVDCMADCKTQMFCTTVGAAPDNSRPCANTAPFCLVDACSATPDPQNEFCAGSLDIVFSCTGAGIFPDPNSCTQYFNCPSAEDNAVLFTCPPGAVFDSKVQSCVLTNSLALRTFNLVQTCSVTTCPRNFVGFVPYKANPVFYVYCLADTRTVFRCPDPENQVFDAKIDPENCSYKCRAAGHFADRLNCNRFYTCTRRGLTYKVDHNTCPPMYWFNNGVCERQGATPCVPQLV